MKKNFTFYLFLLITPVIAQQNIWNETKKQTQEISDLIERNSTPKSFKMFKLNDAILNQSLNTLRNRGVSSTQIISIPNQDGKLIQFKVKEASVLSPELQSKFPDIKSYRGISLDGQSTVRFSYSPYHGLSAVIKSEGNSKTYIDAYTKDLKTYITYTKKNVDNTLQFICNTNTLEIESQAQDIENQLLTNRPATITDGMLRTYRLALSTTVEYSAFHINRAGISTSTLEEKKAVVLSALNVAMTRVNEVYENELSITMQLVPNNDQIIFIDSDNFTNNSGSALLGENQTVVDEVIGTDNYDIGHVFSTGGGGIATLRSPCSPRKARGVTGLSSPINDPFYIDYVAHEMGHQFGANHTFHSTRGSCGGGNKNASTSIEPGSGSTIMAMPEFVVLKTYKIIVMLTLVRLALEKLTRLCVREEHVL